MQRSLKAIEISAIICTHNRAEYLKRAIESLLSQSISEVRYEIIVVDNRSTDNTKKVVDGFLYEAPNVAYYYEPSLGLSKARNRGLKESKSDIILFIDDDAVACPDLLQGHLWAYKNVNPTPVSVAGRIYLDWEIPKPIWYPATIGFERCLTCLDYGDKARFLEFPKREYPFGANMSFLKDAVLEIGGFETKLGRQGKNLLSNEESKIFDLIHKKNMKVYYEPRAYVFHAVLKERIRKRYFYRRFYWQGISNAIWQPSLWALPPKTIIGNIKGLARASLEFLNVYFQEKENEQGRLATICEICFHIGFLKFFVNIFFYFKKTHVSAVVFLPISHGFSRINKQELFVVLLNNPADFTHKLHNKTILSFV